MLNKLKSIDKKICINGFNLVKKFDVKELRLSVYDFKHEKSGSRHVHFDRDDKNKAFSVMFRTNPPDSSGVPHILEHTVLCGSEKFPVRDPFFKMLRRSQSTFMNAMTASDWTMYPFSTLNDTDYFNLMKVYLDSAFRPNINKLDFMQEGWRLEPKDLKDDKSELVFKGIVYNEMKGVFSNSSNIMMQAVENNLLPHSYPFVSGGDPNCIPSLTYENLKKYHSMLYNPANATFLTYGNLDLEACMEYINKNYLEGEYENYSSPMIESEPKWSEPRSLTVFCQPDTMMSDPSRNTSVSLSFRIADVHDTYLNFVMNLLSNLLLKGENAPLYKGLISDTSYGLDWAGNLCGFDKSSRSTTFHIGVEGVKEQEVDQFENRVENLLTEVVNKGFTKERIESVLHEYELAIKKETVKFGLNLILGISYDVNHGVDLEKSLQIQSMIDKFQDDLKGNPKLFSDLIEKYLLKNKHKLTTKLIPDTKYEQELSTKEENCLTQKVKTLTDTDKSTIIEECKHLAENQNKIEDLSCLPCLSLSDVKSETEKEQFEIVNVNGLSIQLNEANTNGIFYMRLLGDLSGLPKELSPYVPLFSSMLTRLGNDTMSYLDFAQQEELKTDGISVSPQFSSLINKATQVDSLNDPVKSIYISTACLNKNIKAAVELLKNILTQTPNWDDHKRIASLILMSAQSEWSANSLSHSAHAFSMRHAASRLNVNNHLSEQWSGLQQASLMLDMATNKISADGFGCDESILSKLEEIFKYISQNSSFRVSLHGDKKSLDEGVSYFKDLSSVLVKKCDITPVNLNLNDATLRNTYFSMPYSVHYVSQAIESVPYLNPSYETYAVLSQLLNAKFLHTEIREKGGAYGGGSANRPGSFLFYSYRDPNSSITLDAFEKSIDWAVSEANFSEQDIKEAKLSIFKDLDYPTSAGHRGVRQFLSGISDAMLQTKRDRLFAVNLADIKKAAETLRDKKRAKCILGPESSYKSHFEASNWENVKISGA